MLALEVEDVEIERTRRPLGAAAPARLHFDLFQAPQ